MPSPKVQLNCVGFPVNELASNETGWPAAGDVGLKVKWAFRFGPPGLEMSTDRKPVAVPQAEFIAVTFFSPALLQVIWTVLPVALPEMNPPDGFQLQPDGLGVQIAALAVNVSWSPGAPVFGPPTKMVGAGLPLEFHWWMSSSDSAAR